MLQTNKPNISIHQKFVLSFSLSLLLMSSLPAFGSDLAMLSTVQDQKGTVEDAKRIYDEGLKLYKQQTANSIREAIKKYEEAGLIFHSNNYIREEIAILNNTGVAYYLIYENQKALELFNKALTLNQALTNRNQGDLRGDGYILRSLATVYERFGEREKAIDFHNQALAIFREVSDKNGEGSQLSSLATIYSKLGEKQKALDYYTQALPLLQATNDKNEEANTTLCIGSLYLSLGESQRALDYYNKALKLAREANYRSREASILSSIGGVYNTWKDYQKTFECLDQALAIYHELGDLEGKAKTLSNMARVSINLKNYKLSVETLDKALIVFRQLGNQAEECSTLNALGAAYLRLADYEKSWICFQQALQISRAIGSPKEEVNALGNIATLERNSGDPKAALVESEKIIKIIDLLRSKIISQDLRASYFATFDLHYKLHIDLLMKMHKLEPSAGYDALALQASEHTRARSLSELLIEAGADIRQGVDVKLVEREKELRQNLNTAVEEQTRLLSSKHNPEQAEAARKKVDKLTEDLQKVIAEICQQSPQYASINYPAPISLQQIQKLLDADTVLLEFSVSDWSSFLWVVGQNSLDSFELPRTEEIEKLALPIYQLLTAKPKQTNSTNLADFETEYLEAATKLSDLLLKPAMSKLKGKRLIIVAC